MHQPAGAAGRARAEIALVDEKDVIARSGEMLRGARAVDAGADDRDREGTAVEFRERPAHPSHLSLTPCPSAMPRATEADSVVNLKFLSLGWHARGRNFKVEDHTRNIDLLVQLLNPKFALRVAPR